MSRLSEIPVRVESSDAHGCGAPGPADGATIGGGVAAILHEIAGRLERLAGGGEPDAIDLRSLPMSPADREQLLAALGPGEVCVLLDADGESILRETGVRGVWWTEHRDADDELVAAYIEIARVPGILVVDDDELQHGARRLRAAGAARAG